jgi:hypothetical protein
MSRLRPLQSDSEGSNIRLSQKQFVTDIGPSAQLIKCVWKEIQIIILNHRGSSLTSGLIKQNISEYYKSEYQSLQEKVGNNCNQLSAQSPYSQIYTMITTKWSRSNGPGIFYRINNYKFMNKLSGGWEGKRASNAAIIHKNTMKLFLTQVEWIGRKKKRKYSIFYMKFCLRFVKLRRFNFFLRETERGLPSNFSMNIIWLDDQNFVWNAVFDNVYYQ